MISGWKDISSRIAAIVGYDISADAARKLASRNRDLDRIIGKSITGQPLVAEYELERWARMHALPRSTRLRRAVRAVIEAGQLALL